MKENQLKKSRTTRVFVLEDGSKVWTNYKGCKSSSIRNWNILTYPNWRSEGPSVVEKLGNEIVKTWCCEKCDLAIENDLVGANPNLECTCDDEI
jgi:hypothetical protein